jgi:DDE superfamily endonuclease
MTDISKALKYEGVTSVRWSSEEGKGHRVRVPAARGGDRAGNCVTWVFAALATAREQARAWSGLYMLKETWAKDPERRETAGIPEGLRFATKPELAIAQVKKLAAAD